MPSFHLSQSPAVAGRGWKAGTEVFKPFLKKKKHIEGSLEVKLPAVWTDEKAEVGGKSQRREEKKKEDQRREESEERRCRCAKR